MKDDGTRLAGRVGVVDELSGGGDDQLVLRSDFSEGGVEERFAYYTGLFGWETEPFAASEVGYTMFKLDGVPFGGVMKTPMPGVPTHWLNYVSVADIDASIATSTGLGGEVVVPPMEVPTV